MLNNLSKLFSEYFFKQRYIYEYVSKSDSLGPFSLRYFSMAEEPVGFFAKQVAIDPRLMRLFRARRGLSTWTAFLLYDKDAIIAYSFLHLPKVTEWHDCLPTQPGEARICNAFVYPEWRGRGLRQVLRGQERSYAQDRRLRLWSVVEQTNKSSIRAVQKDGKIIRTNYLVKFFKFNIVSILTNPLGVYLLVGEKRARR